MHIANEILESQCEQTLSSQGYRIQTLKIRNKELKDISSMYTIIIQH